MTDRRAGVRGLAALLEGRIASGVPIARRARSIRSRFRSIRSRCAPACRVLLDTQNNIRVPSDVSPDGKQIAYFSIGEHQEDIFIGPRGRRRMRRVTDDAPRDRAPVFTPDGRSLVFYSNRDGKWGAWTIGVDGGGLRKIVDPAGGAVYPFVSPKGDTIVFVGDDGRSAFTAPVSSALSGRNRHLCAATPSVASTSARSSGRPMARGSPAIWSPRADGLPASAFTISLPARRSEVSTDETHAVKWLTDSRRVVYFTETGNELVVLDTMHCESAPSLTCEFPGRQPTICSRSVRTIARSITARRGPRLTSGSSSAPRRSLIADPAPRAPSPQPRAPSPGSS